MIIEAGSPDFFERLLCYKSLEWAYEQEVRAFIFFGDSHADFEKNDPQQVHLFALPRECIKEIYVGANASSDTKAKILRSIDKRKLQVKLLEAYVTEDRYALGFREVNDAIYSYRPREFFARHANIAANYTDSIFTYNGLPTQVSVNYGSGIVFPSYKDCPYWG